MTPELKANNTTLPDWLLAEVQAVTSDGRTVTVSGDVRDLAGRRGRLVRQSGDHYQTWEVRWEPDSERVRREARARLDTKRRVRSDQRRYEQVRDSLTGVLRNVAELHAPRHDYEWSACSGCGCDDEGPMDWPCETWLLIDPES